MMINRSIGTAVRRRWLLAVLVGSVSASAWTGERPLKGGEIKPDTLYHNYCSVCHGDKGDGNSRAKNSLVPPPKDFTQSPHLSREYIISVVTSGKPGTAMVSWKTQLSPIEIEALADFVMAAFVDKTLPITAAPKGISGTTAYGGRSAGPAAPVAPAAATPAAPAKADMSLPMPGRLKGDPAAGGRFYRGNCATCHGEKGDGKGPRAYFINPKPRNFLDTASREIYNRPTIYMAVTHGKVGTEMPAWKYVLTEQEIANVAEYVFHSFIQPSATAITGKAGK